MEEEQQQDIVPDISDDDDDDHDLDEYAEALQVEQTLADSLITSNSHSQIDSSNSSLSPSLLCEASSSKTVLFWMYHQTSGNKDQRKKVNSVLS